MTCAQECTGDARRVCRQVLKLPTPVTLFT